MGDHEWDLSGSGQGQMASCYEHSDELLGSIKCGGILD